MILLCPAILLHKKAIPPQWVIKVAGYISMWFPELPFGKRDHKAGYTNLVRAEENKKDPRFYQGKNRLGSGLGLILSALKFKGNLDKVREPFIVVHGTNDVICHVDGARMLTDKAQSKVKTFVEIKGADHVLHEEALEVIQGFTKNCVDFLDHMVLQ
jgi:alpha-beta hydrolase superfamily lysophospholipase